MSATKCIKKSVNNQPIRQKQHLKKKYRHRKTISDQAVQQLQQIDIIESVQEKTIAVAKKKYFPLYNGSNIDPTIFLSDYSILSNQVFKNKMLLTTRVSSDLETKSLKQLLKMDDNLIFIRQLTQLINTSLYLQLQNEQWNYYYHLGMTERIWTGRVSKNMALINSMCNAYGRSKLLIEQRLKKYQNDLTKINNDINDCMTQIPSLLINYRDKITTIIHSLINQDQYVLRLELERRRNILKFDANDHQLVQMFYNLKPRQTGIHSAKLIWKAIHDEYQLRYEIALFKNWLLTSKSSTVTLHTIQDLGLTQINNIFVHIILDQQFLLLSNTNHSTENQINSINQFIENMIKETISTAETYLQKYVQKVNDEKQKILDNQEKFKKPPTVGTVISAIENRQSNMVERAQLSIEQTLKILFPTNNINEHN